MDLLTWKSLDNLGKIEFNQLVRSERLDLRSLKRDWGVETWRQCVPTPLLKTLDKKTIGETGQWLEGRWGPGRCAAVTDLLTLVSMPLPRRYIKLSRQSPNEFCHLSPEREHGIAEAMAVV